MNKLCQKNGAYVLSAPNKLIMERSKRKLENNDSDCFMFILIGLYILKMRSIISVNNTQQSSYQNKTYRIY